MTLAAKQLGAALAVLKRDTVVYLSYKARLGAVILSSFFSLALFYYISRLIKVESIGSPDAYYAFVVVGLVIFQVVQSTLGISALIRGELMMGTFERMVVSPFGPVAGVMSMMLFPFVESFVVAAAMLALGTLVFGLPVTWSTAALGIPIAALGAVTFAAIGLVFAAIVLVFKQAVMGESYIAAGIALISGLYFPVALLPSWVEWTAHVQPFTPTVDLLRHLLVGMPLGESAWLTAGKLTAFAAATLPLAILAVRAAIRIGLKRGTITEY